jgi:hypothetical protein
MERRFRSTLPGRVAELRSRIVRWRRRRAKGSPMPEELWAGAVALAQRHGVYPVARALRVDYGTLKKRATRRPRDGETAEVIPEFVALDPGPLVARTQSAGPVVELWRADGAKLVLRLPADERLDVDRLAEAFWRRHG